MQSHIEFVSLRNPPLTCDCRKQKNKTKTLAKDASVPEEEPLWAENIFFLVTMTKMFKDIDSIDGYDILLKHYVT